MADQSLLLVSDSALTPLPASPDQHPAVVYLAGLTSAASRRTMTQALNTLADLLHPGPYEVLAQEAYDRRFLVIHWEALRYAHTQAIRAQLVERFAPATTNKILAALRGVLEAAFTLDQMGAQDYQRARQVKNVKNEALPAGRDLKIGELKALVDACKADLSPAGARDAALLGVLYTCGIRRAELVSLTLADFDETSGQLDVRQGKGHKDRRVYVTGGALAALALWLAGRGRTPGALFTPVQKGGTILLQPMTAQAVYKLLKKRAFQAGVRDFSPHDLRRTFVSDLLDHGADIATVSKLAGHADVKTTARYDRRPEESKRKASELLHYPF
jgi:integrase/recombinase XerD